jgi:hypothetical protein
MRAGVVAVFVGLVLMFGATSASAKDGALSDLPGLGALERLTGANAPSVTSGTTSTHRVTAADRVPAPASPTTADAKADSPADVEGAEVIRGLPGGSHLPVLGVDAAASQRGSDGMLLALALGICVLFTRFLFRLNTLGHRA